MHLLLRGGCARRIHVDRTGTSELDNKYEAAIANPTASESGIKSERETPSIKKDGTKTARTHSIASRRGIWTSLLASRTATARPSPLTEMAVDVFHYDRGLIDQNPDRQRQSAERHDVDRSGPPPKAPRRRSATQTEW